MWPGTDATPVGMGCMRLSTDPDRDEARGIAVLHAALDAGITLLDTADAYCHDTADTGHNERLIARALAYWSGDRSRIRVATKGGLTRPNGAWVPDGRARHLAAACEASRRALGVDRIDLYQLHAPDWRTPLSTSVRALDALKRDGLIDAIGLSNVTVGQIEEARAITDIAAVQVEMNLWQDAAILGGVADYCIAHDMLLLAYRPVGGPQRRKRLLADRVLAAVAARHQATAFEIALAWLRDLSKTIVPIPGPSRVETVDSIARASTIALTDEDRAQLDERFPAGRLLRVRRPDTVNRAPEPVPDPASNSSDIVLIMGMPAAGKSTVAATFVAQGYTRLNRDDTGGTLAGLLPALDRAIGDGASRIVLDNTYPSRRSRAAVIETARQRGRSVRCLWLATTIEDAQVNAASRLLSRGAALDTSSFRPNVQFRYQRELEPPDAAEGFSQIDVMPFERQRDPSFVHRALIVWGDELLWRTRSGNRTLASADDLEALTERGAVLRRYRDKGWIVLGLSWRPEIADDVLSDDQARDAFTRMQAQLGVAIEIDYCPHGAGPPVCWCRKPLPGLGVQFIHRHRLDASQCLYVGLGPQDPGFARRLGFQFRDAREFFAEVNS